MFLDPDQFIEKYMKEGLPYFKIYKGQSTSERNCITRFEESHNGNDGQELLNEGAENLSNFFAMYQDGNVNIMTKNNKSTKDGAANVVNVRWGNSAVVSSSSPKSYQSNPAAQFGQFQQMFGFIGSIFKEQLQAQTQMMELNYKNMLDSIQKDVQHERDMRELAEELTQPEPPMSETFKRELLGLVRPLATAYLTPSNNMPTPVISGVSAATTDTMDNTQTNKPNTPSNHPMYGASMDLIFNTVQKIAVEIFPEYSINEVMPALYKKCLEQKELIRGQVIPLIEQNRQAANTTNDE